MLNAQLKKDLEGAPVKKSVVNDNIDPQERLRNSLRKLVESVENQQKVTARLKETTLELQSEIQNLGSTMTKYQKSLGRIDVKKLGQKANRLAAIMEPHALQNA